MLVFHSRNLWFHNMMGLTFCAARQTGKYGRVSCHGDFLISCWCGSDFYPASLSHSDATQVNKLALRWIIFMVLEIWLRLVSQVLWRAYASAPDTYINLILRCLFQMLYIYSFCQLFKPSFEKVFRHFYPVSLLLQLSLGVSGADCFNVGNFKRFCMFLYVSGLIFFPYLA